MIPGDTVPIAADSKVNFSAFFSSTSNSKNFIKQIRTDNKNWKSYKQLVCTFFFFMHCIELVLHRISIACTCK